MREESFVVITKLSTTLYGEALSFFVKTLSNLGLGNSPGVCDPSQESISHESFDHKYRATILDGKNLPLTWIWNLPSTCLGAVGSYRNGTPSARNVRTKSTGGFHPAVKLVLLGRI